MTTGTDPNGHDTDAGAGADAGGRGDTKTGDSPGSDELSDIEVLVHGPIARDLLDCMVGRPDGGFAEADAEIVGIHDDPPLSFDVLVEVECASQVSVTNSRTLGKHDVDDVTFHSLDPVDGGINVQVAVEYRDKEFGISFFVPNE